MSKKEEVRDRELESLEGEIDDNTVQNEESTEETAQADELSREEQLENEIADLKDQNLRLFAEFENFRKRTAREKVELYSTANQELMDALIPVLDDFQRSIKANEHGDNEGTKLILNKFESILKSKGLKPMEDCQGKDFDVETMEAITRIPAPSDDLKTKVIDEIEKGYYLGNKVLRYAKVVVGE